MGGIGARRAQEGSGRRTVAMLAQPDAVSVRTLGGYNHRDNSPCQQHSFNDWGGQRGQTTGTAAHP
eukprot:1153717-Pyramimonas_sp.AAC.1